MAEQSPLLTVYPSSCLVDEKIEVEVKGLPADSKVTVHALVRSDDGDDWEAFGHYTSDPSGTVKVSRDKSVGGTFEGIEAMGLLWSMRPVPETKPGRRFRKTNVQTPVKVVFSVHEGHLDKGFKHRTPLSSTAAERWYLTPEVQRVEVTEGEIKGTLFIPAGSGPFPAVLDLWGGQGGRVEYRSALLASHGYVSLALEYVGLLNAAGELQHADNSYFEAAFTFLQKHPRVCPDKVAVMGMSFGVSVTLGLTAYSEIVEPKCVVCVSGSHIMPLKGSLADVYAALQQNVHKIRYDEKMRIIWRDLLLPIPDDPSQKVKMSEIKCPVLLIAGEDDQNWPASESAADMRKMMEKAGNSHLLTVLSYPGTGHLIEPPYSPHVRFSDFKLLEAKTKVVVLWGGETEPHSRAQEESWKKTLAFLEEHLYGNSREVTRM
ncbi:acyl-CoA thioesterase 19 isoform X1 [Danio rerio]|uniref:Acyl-CoA thioesterase 19 n=1 Tax=Danio rerio TaxID=7955 RepID=Q5U3W6_DANRE|nr:acyl-CoA thioesterase 19 [Danio rerio]XP_021326158.1 peroxisomal acyl-CoA thioesterase 2b like 3 isoform X1 [Danio rerio]AAH85366.1 Zgc:101553 [Danio rerio]AAI65207.1 Zgc:101553 protein [Danio rerio]|eukprot:NP_001007420.1 peroxisomal acyl-CoA thioesterase 2b like 3 [Danio rerio]